MACKWQRSRAKPGGTAEEEKPEVADGKVGGSLVANGDIETRPGDVVSNYKKDRSCDVG